MKRALLALVAAACTGQVSDFPSNPVPDAGTAPAPDAGGAGAPMPTSEAGGTMMLERCGYTVTTRSGATPPWIAPADAKGPDPEPRQVHLGIAGDPARSMAVLWRTRDGSTLATSVRYGIDGTAEQREEGLTFTFRSGSAVDSPRIRMHETHLCGLRPDTVYRYQVGADGAWSPEYTFRTAPDPVADPSAPVTVLVLGDARGGQTTFGSLLESAEAVADPDLILFTGDAVSSGVGQSEWDALFDNGMNLLPYVPILFTNGNHEDNALNLFSQIAQPGSEDIFGLDYGPIHLTVLNDSPRDEGTIAGDQRTFLAADLAAHVAAPWRLLLHHRSMWSSSTSGHGSSTSLQSAWGPTVDAGRVQLVLSGHDHDYERTKPLFAKQVVAQTAGTTYIVAGGSGAPLYDNGHSWFTAFSEKRRHFVVLSVRAGAIDGRAYRDDGSVMDTFSLAR